MNPSFSYGVQSYCYRNFKDNAVVAKKVREIGLNQIEVCGVHADFSKPDAFKEVVDTYKKADVSIVSLGVQTFTGHPDERKWFECAAAAGAKHISCHFRVDCFLTAIPQVRKWSREFGIRVGLHTHGGWMFGGSPDVVEYLLNLGGPEIGVCIDTAWVLQIGPYRGNPVEWAQKFAGRIYGLHLKDFTFDKRGQWKDTIVGAGNLDLPAFTKALLEGGFDGMAVIEYEADAEDPNPPLKSCVDAMKAVVG